MPIPWATNLIHFHLNRLLKMVSNLALFCLATVLATFQKIGQFFPNHLVSAPFWCVKIKSLVLRVFMHSDIMLCVVAPQEPSKLKQALWNASLNVWEALNAVSNVPILFKWVCSKDNLHTWNKLSHFLEWFNLYSLDNSGYTGVVPMKRRGRTLDS
jgi:hypothetical protein